MARIDYVARREEMRAVARHLGAPTEHAVAHFLKIHDWFREIAVYGWQIGYLICFCVFLYWQPPWPLGWAIFSPSIVTFPLMVRAWNTTLRREQALLEHLKDRLSVVTAGNPPPEIRETAMLPHRNVPSVS